MRGRIFGLEPQYRAQITGEGKPLASPGAVQAAAFDGRESDAAAVEPGSATEVDAACLRGKCTDDPELGHELYRRFATMLKSRLHATRLQLLDLYGPGDAR